MDDFLLWLFDEEEEEEEEERRRREEERRRREEEEEEERRRQEEERQKMIKHRKEAPVVFSSEDWQINRCVKAFSLQQCVQRLISVIEKERPKVIEAEERKYDEKIMSVGYDYEVLRNDVNANIDKLKKLGISVSGKQSVLSRLKPSETHIAIIEQTTDYFGRTFTINNGQPIELNSDNLLKKGYFENRYNETNPKELEKKITDVDSKINRYQRFGKRLKFLLNTNGYQKLEKRLEKLSEKKEQSELRKKEMESFKSLTNEQKLAIKLYFDKLDELAKISDKIKYLFIGKASLKKEDNEQVYDLTIKALISSNEHIALLNQVYEYIRNIHTNDEKTMQEAYELVKGEYPIKIDRRYLYDLIIADMGDYEKKVVSLRDIKTYEDLDRYCEDVGYENLTDEDIENLRKKVWEIYEIKEKEIEAGDEASPVKFMLIQLAKSGAVSRCDHLDNCTEERRRRNNFRKIEEADRRAPGIIRDDLLLSDKERRWENTYIRK